MDSEFYILFVIEHEMKQKSEDHEVINTFYMSSLGVLEMFWEVVGDSVSKTSSSIPSSIGFIVVDTFVREFFSGGNKKKQTKSSKSKIMFFFVAFMLTLCSYTLRSKYVLESHRRYNFLLFS